MLSPKSGLTNGSGLEAGEVLEEASEGVGCAWAIPKDTRTKKDAAIPMNLNLEIM
jgi:hypothetical protein